jgi:L-ascorbate metabolism protein UlaG (beta-lactamase superfamily)
MKLRTAGLLLLVAACAVLAQPSLTRIQVLTNKEVLLRLNSSNGLNYRIDASTNPPQFDPLLTFRSTGVSHHIDTAGPYLRSRFYRAAHLTNSDVITGDHVVTTNGDVIIQPINHASFVMSWNGKMIYNDPVCAATLYTGFPKADLILLSHHHGDHFNPTTINSVTNATTRIIAPQATYNAMSSTSMRSITTVLGYGASTTILGISVQAVRATNANHLEGVNNAYVTTIGGKRILTTGDCGPGPDLRALQDIDIMFVCMNSFTMEVATAASLIRDMRPKVVFPYHYGSQCSSPSYDVQMFKRLVGQDRGIEVRLRKWY